MKFLAFIGKTIVATLVVLMTLIAAVAALTAISTPHVETHHTNVYGTSHSNT